MIKLVHWLFRVFLLSSMHAIFNRGAFERFWIRKCQGRTVPIWEPEKRQTVMKDDKRWQNTESEKRRTT